MQPAPDSYAVTNPHYRNFPGPRIKIPGRSSIEPPTSIDRLIHSLMGRLTLGISPASVALAYADWAFHLSESPGKWHRLAEKAVQKEMRLLHYTARLCTGATCEPCIEPLPQDRRFHDPGWQRWPFSVIYQSFLLNQQWWHNATTGIGGVSKHHEQVVAFMARQLLDMVSPVNFIATNPTVQATTLREGGQNLLRGALNLIEDAERTMEGRPPVETDAFRPGQEVAVTKGQVIYRNRLIELIQYAPQTAQVHAEPVLIVPAWIMKYYILDLSPSNSLVKYLVERGHTVFMISWRNPDANDRDLGMEDYLRLGLLDALHAVQTIVPKQKVNAIGYCLGGTLLTIAASFLAQNEKDNNFNSLTLLAAQTDFSEAGELTLFIDESQVDYLEDIMWRQGYLDTRQMAGAFQLLRSHDLIWSVMVNQYLMGQRTPMTDLMAWNADPTRLPYHMHSEYLRQFFLDNDLFQGRYKVHDKPIALSDIRAPMFVVATERDHVAPWHSVYKINLIADADVSFLLTSGGHNAGIVSEPGHRGRYYRMAHRKHGEKYIDPDTWYLSTPSVEGSWWSVWADWLEKHASGRVAPPPMGARDKGYLPLCPAPGSYVLER